MKRTTKLVSVLLAVLLACSSFAILPTFAYEHSSKAPGSQYEFGDVNRDGVIDIMDATLVQKKAADKAVLDDEQIILGDVNGDGEVDIIDATLIQKFVVDRIDKFQVEDIVPTEPTTEPTDEPTTEEPTEPATNEPTEPAETIAVYFTDAQNFGDVHVYYWPNGGDWPGVAAVEKETNDFGQKVYQATVPADVNGIIFNGNGKQTVDITRGIEDGAWWYTLDTQEDGKYNVELVNAPTDPTDPTDPSTEEPATEPTTEEPAAEDVYSVAGSSADIFGSAWDAESKTTEMTKGADGVYSITFEDVQPESNVEYKVVKNHNWDTAYPAQNATFTVTAVSDVTITFDPATSAVNVTVTPTGEPEPEPQGTVVKLKPNSNWTQANARFAVYVFNNSTGKSEWADMTAVGDGTYTVTLPEGDWEQITFCRMNPSAAANNWDNKWNQSNDLDIVAGKTYVVPTDAWDKWTA